MDVAGKIVYARNTEILTTTVQQAIGGDGADEVEDGQKLQLSMKELGGTEIYPTSLQHSPNGRCVPSLTCRLPCLMAAELIICYFFRFVAGSSQSVEMASTSSTPRSPGETRRSARARRSPGLGTAALTPSSRASRACGCTATFASGPDSSRVVLAGRSRVSMVVSCSERGGTGSFSSGTGRRERSSDESRLTLRV